MMKKPLRRLLCKLTDCRYAYTVGIMEPRCERCESDCYYPARRTIGRLITDWKARRWRKQMFSHFRFRRNPIPE